MSYKEQGFTDIITDKHPAKELLCVIDENGMPIKKVQTYNTKTKEVTVYRYGPDNKPMWDGENSAWLTDTYIAYGSRIVFKDYEKEINIEGEVFQFKQLAPLIDPKLIKGFIDRNK